MKITSVEEFGLRILIQIASSKDRELTIAQIAQNENITHANVAKICRLLRMHHIIESSKGHTGGYKLVINPLELTLDRIMNALGDPLYSNTFCDKFSESPTICKRSVDCTIRSVWKILQLNIDHVLQKITLQDLLTTESEVYNTNTI